MVHVKTKTKNNVLERVQQPTRQCGKPYGRSGNIERTCLDEAAGTVNPLPAFKPTVHTSHTELPCLRFLVYLTHFSMPLLIETAIINIIVIALCTAQSTAHIIHTWKNRRLLHYTRKYNVYFFILIMMMRERTVCAISITLLRPHICARRVAPPLYSVAHTKLSLLEPPQLLLPPQSPPPPPSHIFSHQSSHT